MANNTTLKVGDIVYLNSGSPRLTVEEILGERNLIKVCWLDAINKLQRDNFPSACLTTTPTHNTSNTAPQEG